MTDETMNDAEMTVAEDAAAVAAKPAKKATKKAAKPAKKASKKAAKPVAKKAAKAAKLAKASKADAKGKKAAGRGRSAISGTITPIADAPAGREGGAWAAMIFAATTHKTTQGAQAAFDKAMPGYGKVKFARLVRKGIITITPAA